MPTYEYACTECGDRTEVVQSIADAPPTICTVCGGRLRKVFSPVGIVFKGSGFYRTDSRGKAKTDGDKAKKPAETTSSSGSSDAKKPDSGSSTSTPKAAEKSA
jgi:putative FmdB family regulatory protein